MLVSPLSFQMRFQTIFHYKKDFFQCTIFGVIRGRLAVAGIGMVIEAVKRDIGSDPVSRFAASFPLLRLLSVATRGQTPCCQPRFARWHIGSDPCRFLSFPVASCRFLSLPGCHPGCAELLGATWGLTLLCHRVLLGWQQRV